MKLTGSRLVIYQTGTTHSRTTDSPVSQVGQNKASNLSSREKKSERPTAQIHSGINENLNSSTPPLVKILSGVYDGKSTNTSTTQPVYSTPTISEREVKYDGHQTPALWDKIRLFEQMQAGDCSTRENSRNNLIGRYAELKKSSIDMTLNNDENEQPITSCYMFQKNERSKRENKYKKEAQNTNELTKSRNWLEVDVIISYRNADTDYYEKETDQNLQPRGVEDSLENILQNLDKSDTEVVVQNALLPHFGYVKTLIDDFQKSIEKNAAVTDRQGKFSNKRNDDKKNNLSKAETSRSLPSKNILQKLQLIRQEYDDSANVDVTNENGISAITVKKQIHGQAKLPYVVNSCADTPEDTATLNGQLDTIEINNTENNKLKINHTKERNGGKRRKDVEKYERKEKNFGKLREQATIYDSKNKHENTTKNHPKTPSKLQDSFYMMPRNSILIYEGDNKAENFTYPVPKKNTRFPKGSQSGDSQVYSRGKIKNILENEKQIEIVESESILGNNSKIDNLEGFPSNYKNVNTETKSIFKQELERKLFRPKTPSSSHSVYSSEETKSYLSISENTPAILQDFNHQSKAYTAKENYESDRTKWNKDLAVPSNAKQKPKESILPIAVKDEDNFRGAIKTPEKGNSMRSGNGPKKIQFAENEIEISQKPLNGKPSKPKFELPQKPKEPLTDYEDFDLLQEVGHKTERSTLQNGDIKSNKALEMFISQHLQKVKNPKRNERMLQKDLEVIPSSDFNKRNSQEVFKNQKKYIKDIPKDSVPNINQSNKTNQNIPVPDYD